MSRAPQAALPITFLLCALNAAQLPAQSPPTDLWENNDTWNLEVRAAGYDNDFIVRLTITELDEHGWSLGFLPLNAAPDGLQGQWHVVAVSKDTGFPIQAWNEDEDITVEHVHGASFVTGMPFGVPLEWLNANELPEGTFDLHGKRTVTINKRTQDNKYLLEMIVMQNNVELLRVLQTWVEGEKWWHSYERRVKGEVVLSARLLDVEAVKSQRSEVGGQRSGIIYSQRPAIALDPRLKGRIELVARHPKVEDVLRVLSSESGLRLTIDPALADEAPDLGEIELYSSECWSVMNYVAVRYPMETEWLRTEDGYVLCAVPGAEERASWWKRFRAFALIGTITLIGILGTRLAFALIRLQSKHENSKDRKHEKSLLEPCC